MRYALDYEPHREGLEIIMGGVQAPSLHALNARSQTATIRKSKTRGRVAAKAGTGRLATPRWT